MDKDLIMIIGVMVCVFLAVLGIAYMLSNSEPEIPLSCGITEENHSESYTVTSFILVGKVMVPTTTVYYHHDLVCTNGTVILKFR